MQRAKLSGCLVLLATVCACQPAGPEPAASTPAAPPAPRYSVALISTECAPNYGRNRADITIRNTGPAIPYAKGLVQFVDAGGNVLSAQDTYFRPSSIPAGSTATLTVYSSGGGAASCGLMTVQDGDGIGASISPK